ncbi:MAG: magnesium/cobalt transporter CorA [Thermodesulfobacteriota bacterium]|nr:magnesium/cobalt transporter CorA [Thermodesulfobacteriota bacterium]
MSYFFKKRVKQAGLSPGTLVHIGEKKTDKARITVMNYDQTRVHEQQVETIEECSSFKDKPAVTWINIDGVHQTEIVEKIGGHFGIHPLVLEDIVHTGQRPKIEDFEEYVFLVIKMLSLRGNAKEIEEEQIGIVFGSDFVISFQESPRNVFDPIRERIRKGKGRIRKMGTDYLAYALTDAIVDHYFIILESIGERIESLEDELISNPTPETLQVIHHLKREMIFLRKSVWPLREVLSGLERGESSLVEESTRVFLRDVYDHTIQVIDTIETFRDMISGMLDVYLSSVSNKMNEVMKVLTLIATIFIPLTFIAGIYGMNFKFMPELELHWAYPVTWAVMIIVGILMVIYFKRKKWL